MLKGMTRGVFRYFVAPLVCVGLLSGCRFGLFDRREPWRAEAEEQCIAQKGITVSAYVEPASAINGPGVCGMEHPFRITAFDDGQVEVKPRAVLACPMARNVNIWLEEVVQPAAMAWMGAPVVGITQMSSYSCRGMNGDPNAKISEHAFGNALDIGAFRFADGREISVKNNWRGPNEARGFLLQVQAGACDVFTTTLAPGSNIFHYDHLHVDLMRHAKGATICKPKPSPMPPPVMARQQMPLKAPAGNPLIAPPSFPYGNQPAIAPPSYPQPLPQKAPSSGYGGPMSSLPPAAPEAGPRGTGAPMDISPHPQGALPPQAEPPAQAAYPQPAYPPPYVKAPPAQPSDPFQRVLMPPGAVPQPSTLRPPGPMSYAPTQSAPAETGSVPPRRYYSVPIPQASPLPLPPAEPGAD